MDKADQILCGLGGLCILIGASFIDVWRTNKQVRAAAVSTEVASRTLTKAVSDCTVNVRRCGKDQKAVAITTPALADVYRNFKR